MSYRQSDRGLVQFGPRLYVELRQGLGQHPVSVQQQILGGREQPD